LSASTKTKSYGPSRPAHGDPVGVRALGDVAARDLGVLRLELARIDVPARRQPRRHRERRVAAVGADLQHAPRADPEDEQLEEPPLDRAGEHLRRVESRARLLGERLEQGGRSTRVRLDERL